MTLLLAFIVFFIGACVGSFVNVLISRSLEGKDWVKGRSKCDHCKRVLSWYDNIPLFSYIVYRGVSRCCHKKLTLRHLIVESIFGILFIWWLIVGFLFFQLASGPWIVLQPLFWLGIAIILMIIATADFLHGVIFMPLIYIGVVWVYVYRALLYLGGTYNGNDLIGMLVAGGLSFGFLWFLRFITKGRGMGDGDPYLAFLTGSLLGIPRAGTGMLAAFIIGAIWGVILLLMKKKNWGQTLPFGPFLVVGCLVGLLFTHF